MHTEEQARTKWCPHVRVSDGSWNRKWSLNTDGKGQERARCIASECMAWRWFDDVTDDGTACNHKPTAKAPRVSEPPPAMGRPLAERRGYCGLASAS
jgi:hypothetical protein